VRKGRLPAAHYDHDMPLTQLDPTSALILIDLQKGIVDSVRPAVDGVLANAGALAEAFRAHGRTVVLVNVAGGAPGRTDAAAAAGAQPARPEGFADLVAELGSAPQDILLTKHRWGAFTGSDLDKQLRALGVTQVVLGGVSTSIGVETTARSAYELGLRRRRRRRRRARPRPRLPRAHDHADLPAPRGDGDDRGDPGGALEVPLAG
jgi:isochorismate hydrolase